MFCIIPWQTSALLFDVRWRHVAVGLSCLWGPDWSNRSHGTGTTRLNSLNKVYIAQHTLGRSETCVRFPLIWIGMAHSAVNFLLWCQKDLQLQWTISTLLYLQQEHLKYCGKPICLLWVRGGIPCSSYYHPENYRAFKDTSLFHTRTLSRLIYRHWKIPLYILFMITIKIS